VILIGLVGGAGIGFAYVVPIAVGMRWFPDKKGMITGLAVAGFGFGAMLWVKLAGSWGHLIENIGPFIYIYNLWDNFRNNGYYWWTLDEISSCWLET